MKELGRELDHIWTLEDIKASQRSRDRMIREGGRNTAYFHVVANHRNRKKKFEGLMGAWGMIRDTLGILKIASTFYKDLFWMESRGNFELQSDFLG
jgi:hypothetical protein